MISGKRELLIICDASLLILLAKLKRLDLLRALSDEIWIPEAVWREVVSEGAGRPEVRLIENEFSTAIRRADVELEAAFRLQVDAGEAAALALAAHHRHACLLMDDARGRMVAELNDFRCIGTLGWLMRAKTAGLVPALLPLFAQLKAAGWHIEERLLKRALTASGEDLV
jgi:predicted nucleic acid-binding protein